jgi:hypothetical protein
MSMLLIFKQTEILCLYLYAVIRVPYPTRDSAHIAGSLHLINAVTAAVSRAE